MIRGGKNETECWPEGTAENELEMVAGTVPSMFHVPACSISLRGEKEIAFGLMTTFLPGKMGEQSETFLFSRENGCFFFPFSRAASQTSIDSVAIDQWKNRSLHHFDMPCTFSAWLF